MAVGNGTITRASKDSTRSALDFYPTPAIAVHTLLDEELFVGDVWECASGRGDISLALLERGLSVVSSDVQGEGWIFGERAYEKAKPKSPKQKGLDCLRCSSSLEPGPRKIRRLCRTCREEGWCTTCTVEKVARVKSKGQCKSCIRSARSKKQADWRANPAPADCTKCGTAFLRNSKHTRCGPCRTKYSAERWAVYQDTYQKKVPLLRPYQRSRQKAYHKERRRSSESVILELFGDGTNYICGTCELKHQEKRAFSLHHKDPSKKTVSFTKLLRRGSFSKEMLGSETGTLLCHNCHRLEHVNPESPSYRAKTRLLGGVADRLGVETLNCAGCLVVLVPGITDFHHKDPKEKDFPVCKARRLTEAVWTEVKKCVPLCAICHSLVHSGYLDDTSLKTVGEMFTSYEAGKG